MKGLRADTKRDVCGTVLPYDSLPVLSFERFAIHAISLKSMRLIFALSNVTNVNDHAEYLAMESVDAVPFTTKKS